MAKPQGECFTVDQIAEFLKVSTKTVRRYISRPASDPLYLPITKVGAAVRVSQASYDEWVERNTLRPRF